jgi:hypothetical protein
LIQQNKIGRSSDRSGARAKREDLSKRPSV